jgi:hypothetical protein
MKVQVGVIEGSQLKGVKPKIIGCKLRSGVYWQKGLKRRGVKQVGCKTRARCTWFHDFNSNKQILNVFVLFHV